MYIVPFCVMLACTEPASAVASEITLGGPRQATATVSVEKSHYVITLIMRPIRVFDEATNKLLNYEKARELALIALAKHLSKADAVQLSVTGAETEKRVDNGKSYSLTLRVPIKGVSLTNASNSLPTKTPESAKNRVLLNSSLLSVVADYKTMIHRLCAATMKEVAKAESDKAFDAWVAAAKERTLTNLEKVERAISGDLRLLSTEQADLRRTVAKARASFLAGMQKAVADHKKQHQDTAPQKK